MPSIINSDDGVVSGTSGLKSTGGNDGLLNIQSNGSTVVAVTGSGISVTGTVSQTGVSTFAAGTVSAPSITFTGDTNTGIFSPAADTIAFTEGGTEAMRINSSANVLIGTTTSPSSAEVPLVVARGSGSYIQVTKTNATAGGAAIGTTGSSIFMFTHTGAVGAETYTSVFELAKDKSLALQGATSQTGAGITFPATQSASSDANTLDDYEEGTWTPTAAGTSGSLTSYTSNGTYTKIGDLVFVRGRILLTNVGTAGGALNAGGLPFTTSNGVRPFVGVCREDEQTGTGYLTWATTSGTTFTINTFTNGAITWTNNYAYVFSATYKAA